MCASSNAPPCATKLSRSLLVLGSSCAASIFYLIELTFFRANVADVRLGFQFILTIIPLALSAKHHFPLHEMAMLLTASLEPKRFLTIGLPSRNPFKPLRMRLRIFSLITWFGPPTPFPTQSVNFEKLWQVVRDADGAAGCDGWSASELRYLPLSAIRLWHDLGTRWLVAEQVPQQLTQVRQVNLAKSHKIDNQGNLAVNDLRPISVLSSFWRLWSSAFIKDARVQSWISLNKHKNVVHGKGSLGCEVSGQLLQDAYMSDSYLCSLDYQEAYDRMNPQITANFLLSIGWPRGFVMVLLSVWKNQQRFIQFEGHVHPVILAASKSSPQGCPCVPAMLALWMSSGFRFLEVSFGRLPGQVCVYVDDRTFTGAVWIHKSKRGSCFPIRLVYVNLETKLKSLLEAVTTNAFLTPTVILPGFKMKSNFWDFPQFRSPVPILPLKQSESEPLSLGRRCLAAQVCNGDVLF